MIFDDGKHSLIGVDIPTFVVLDKMGGRWCLLLAAFFYFGGLERIVD